MRKQPHPYLLEQLVGLDVPEDFLDNGCSNIPDLWMKWACRIHDYEYYWLRRLNDLIEDLRKNFSAKECIGKDTISRDKLESVWKVVYMFETEMIFKAVLDRPTLDEYRGHPYVRIKELSLLHKLGRKLSDKHLRKNTRLLTLFDVKEVDGMPKFVFRPLRGTYARFLNWAMYAGVRLFGSRSAKSAPKQERRNK